MGNFRPVSGHVSSPSMTSISSRTSWSFLRTSSLLSDSSVKLSAAGKPSACEIWKQIHLYLPIYWTRGLDLGFEITDRLSGFVENFVVDLLHHPVDEIVLEFGLFYFDLGSGQFEREPWKMKKCTQCPLQDGSGHVVGRFLPVVTFLSILEVRILWVRSFILSMVSWKNRSVKAEYICWTSKVPDGSSRNLFQSCGACFAKSHLFESLLENKLSHFLAITSLKFFFGSVLEIQKIVRVLSRTI